MAKPRHAALIYREIGVRIRTARQKTGMTQEEAAAAAAIGYKRWQDLEAGRTNTTILTLIRIAAALGVDFWTVVRPSVKRKRGR